jgi:hypothetical protein
MSKKQLIVVLVMIMAFTATYAHAHQPRIAFGSRHPLEAPIVIEKPEISKAYYGELKGEADYYTIESDKSFKLYLNILAPDQEGARTDTSVDVTSGSQKIATLKGSSAEWKSFFEEFARDNYLRGPEFEQMVPAGRYYLKVYNRDNRGKYSLAVGDIESFPLDETIKTALRLPSIKKHFFNKPAISAFFNLVGLFLAIELAIGLGLILGIVFVIRNKIRKI